MRRPSLRRGPPPGGTLVEIVRIIVREELEALGFDTSAPRVHVPEQPPEPPIHPKEQQ